MIVDTSKNFSKNFISIEDIFDLETHELSLFLRKKDDAPIGNLREIYHTQSNRGLISKIARELITIILWEVIEGKTFYFPGTRKAKIFVSAMGDGITKVLREKGRFQDLDFYMTDFRIPQLQLYTPINQRGTNMCVYVNNDLHKRIIELANTTGRVGGKIPFKLPHILPHLYKMFSYIEKDCIKLICKTFLRRLRVISHFGCDLLVKDRHNVIRFFNGVSAKYYYQNAYFKKEFVMIKLRQDKLKYFPCLNKQQTVLMS